MGNTFQEILDEFQTVVLGKHKILDSIIPPVVFLIVNAIAGLEMAAVSAIFTALGFTMFRLIRKQPVGYALGGFGGVLLALLLAWITGRAANYFVPQILSSSITAAACLISVFFRRPLVAYTSHLTRRWPLDWYWHDRVRPAYSEVSLIWAVFFGIRTYIQFTIWQSGEAAAIGFLNVLMGWPALIVLLILSYMYGLWRLRSLGGPSVGEFTTGQSPPWEGQRKGF